MGHRYIALRFWPKLVSAGCLVLVLVVLVMLVLVLVLMVLVLVAVKAAVVMLVMAVLVVSSGMLVSVDASMSAICCRYLACLSRVFQRTNDRGLPARRKLCLRC